MEKNNLIEKFKTEYSLSYGSPKWVPKGGDLLKYSGQSLFLIKFKKKDKDSSWETENELVDVIGICDFDEMTGTYKIVWKSAGENQELHEERILPEGFSFNIPDQDLWMHRFLPLSLHMRLTEESIIYDRFKRLLSDRPSMDIQTIRNICQGNQKETTGYRKYITLLCDTTDGIGVGVSEIRIKSFSMPQNSGKFWSVGLHLWDDEFIVVRIPKDSETDPIKLTISGSYIGQAKIIDIQE